MNQNESNLLSEHPFWMAITKGDVDSARALLEVDPTLVRRDFRPTQEQDPHTFGFPLVKAADIGNLDIIALLLEFGADIDAKSPCEEQREFGSPIMLAFERRRYDVINFMLDRGASVAAYGWCYPSLVDLVYEEALSQGGKQELARKGFVSYLGPTDYPPIQDNAHDAVKLFDRLLDMGGQPSMGALAEFRYYDLVEQLLRTCPGEPATIHDYPPGNVFESLCHSASWHGIPIVLDLAMQHCSDRYSPNVAVDVLRSAIKSHNRVGRAAEYYELVETQLKYLQDQQALESVIARGEFLPHFLLAEDYLWPGWCGPEEAPSTVQTMIELSELFIRYGFTNINGIDAESKQTALAKARSRADHPGLSEFADYLISLGGL